MKLGHFLDAAYVLLIEAYQHAGKLNLFDALDQGQIWKAGYTGEVEEGPARPKAQAPDKNDQALMQLQALLAGT